MCTLPAHEPHEPFNVRHAWVTIALQAVSQGASAFVLYGNDIVLETSWAELLIDVWASFDSIADRQLSPPPTAGTKAPTESSDAADDARQKLWGCVVLRDRQAPGWPCFPVIGNAHMLAFGEVLPKEFVNQEIDPFLFELYRRLGLTAVTDRIHIYNQQGGVMVRLFLQLFCAKFVCCL